jgi:hypothetical protein
MYYTFISEFDDAKFHHYDIQDINNDSIAGSICSSIPSEHTIYLKNENVADYYIDKLYNLFLNAFTSSGYPTNIKIIIGYIVSNELYTCYDDKMVIKKYIIKNGDNVSNNKCHHVMNQSDKHRCANSIIREIKLKSLF